MQEKLVNAFDNYNLKIAKKILEEDNILLPDEEERLALFLYSMAARSSEVAVGVREFYIQKIKEMGLEPKIPIFVADLILYQEYLHLPYDWNEYKITHSPYPIIFVGSNLNLKVYMEKIIKYADKFGYLSKTKFHRSTVEAVIKRKANLYFTWKNTIAPQILLDLQSPFFWKEIT